MATLGSKAVGSNVKFKVSGAYRDFKIINVENNRIWLIQRSLGSVKWDEINGELSEYASYIDGAIYGKIINIGYGKVFILAKEDLEGSGKISYLNSYSVSNLVSFTGAMWTSSEAGAGDGNAWGIAGSSGVVTAIPKTNYNGIAPVVVLPTDIEVDSAGHIDGNTGGSGEGTLIEVGNPLPNITLTYNGENQTMTFTNSTRLTIGGNSATNAGTYTAWAYPNAGCCWKDTKTTEIRYIEWSIGRKKVSKPTQKGTLTYNGHDQTPEWNNYTDGDGQFTIGGVYQDRIEADTYFAQFTPTSNCCWSDEGTETREARWTIGAKRVKVPKLSFSSVTYDKTDRRPELDNPDEDFIYVDGYDYHTNVDTYEITFRLKNTQSSTWDVSGYPTANRTVKWTINKRVIALPVVTKTSFTYDGKEHIPTADYDEEYVSVEGYTEQKDAHEYTITFRLKDTNNCRWNTTYTENFTIDRTVKWTINKRAVKPPTLASNTLTYNGNYQYPVINNPDETTVSLSGDLSAKDVGDYEIKANLVDIENYEWDVSGKGTAERTLNWYITRKVITATPKQKGVLIYNGKDQSPEWEDYYPEELEISGRLSATDANSYTANFTPTKNYKRANGSTAAFGVTWKIDPKLLLVPRILPNEFVYSGETFYPKIIDFDEKTMTKSGTESARDANSYSVTFALVSTRNYRWNDGTSIKKEVKWDITRKPIPKPKLSSSSFVYDGTYHYVVLEDFDEATMTKSGTESAVNATSYSVKVGVRSNYQWDDYTTDTFPLFWKIERMVIPYPYVEKELHYNGFEQTQSFANYDSVKMRMEGTVRGTSPTSYSASFYPTNNYMWKDGTTGRYIVNWYIKRRIFSVPYLSPDKFIYDGEEHAPEMIGYKFPNYTTNPISYTGVSKATEIGEYSVTFDIKNKLYNMWEDETDEGKTVYWSIVSAEPKGIGYPTLKETLIYNGSSQSPEWENYDGTKMTIGGETEGINAGEYTATFTPNTGFVWADGSSEPYTVVWKIEKRAFEIPELIDSFFVYDGERHSPRIKGYVEGFMTIDGDRGAVDVGEYAAHIGLADAENCVWADGTAESKPLTWEIVGANMVANVPYQINSLIYNGSRQSPEWENYNPSAMILLGGNPWRVDAGQYTVLFRLKEGYIWTDGSTGDAEVRWDIRKFPVGIPQNRGGQYVDAGGVYYPVWDGYAASIMTIGGETSATDHDVHLAVFDLNDKENYRWSDGTLDPQTVPWQAALLYDHDIKPAPDDEGNGFGENDGDPDKVPEDNAVGTEEKPNIGDLDPEDIIGVIEKDVDEDIWSVGDAVPIKLDGVVGNVIFKDAWFYAYIIGFDHNEGIEGNKTIHFQFAKLDKNNREIAFVDKNYGGLNGGFRMNKAESSEGGWKDSYMRNVICEQFYKVLPEKWRKIIIPITKYTDNGGVVTATQDKIFLLSEFECLGRNVSSNSDESKYQEQYDYYKENGYKGKGMHNSVNEGCECWLRSPFADDNDSFCKSFTSSASPGGGCAGEQSDISLGFAPCFAIGVKNKDSGGGEAEENPKGEKLHIPKQIEVPRVDGSPKTPEWDEFNKEGIEIIGGDIEETLPGIYHIILEPLPGYIWEDEEPGVKIVPWEILDENDPEPEDPPPIKVHIPKQINPPYYDGTLKIPEWDEWNKIAIITIGGTLREVFVDTYIVTVELEPGYIWEDDTVEIKDLPWVILPLSEKLEEEDPTIPEEPDIIESKKEDEPDDEEDSDDRDDHEFDPEPEPGASLGSGNGCCFCGCDDDFGDDCGCHDEEDQSDSG